MRVLFYHQCGQTIITLFQKLNCFFQTNTLFRVWLVICFINTHSTATLVGLIIDTFSYTSSWTTGSTCQLYFYIVTIILSYILRDCIDYSHDVSYNYLICINNNNYTSNSSLIACVVRDNTMITNNYTSLHLSFLWPIGPSL